MMLEPSAPASGVEAPDEVRRRCEPGLSRQRAKSMTCAIASASECVIVSSELPAPMLSNRRCAPP